MGNGIIISLEAEKTALRNRKPLKIILFSLPTGIGGIAVCPDRKIKGQCNRYSCDSFYSCATSNQAGGS